MSERGGRSDSEMSEERAKKRVSVVSCNDHAIRSRNGSLAYVRLGCEVYGSIRETRLDQRSVGSSWASPSRG